MNFALQTNTDTFSAVSHWIIQLDINLMLISLLSFIVFNVCVFTLAIDYKLLCLYVINW